MYTLLKDVFMYTLDGLHRDHFTLEEVRGHRAFMLWRGPDNNRLIQSRQRPLKLPLSLRLTHSIVSIPNDISLHYRRICYNYRTERIGC